MFTGNSATSYGGAIFQAGSTSVSISNSTLTGNSAQSGGAMYSQFSSGSVTNCIFSGNTVVQYGGGLVNVNTSPTYTNCLFTGNSAPNGGSGVWNWSNATANFINCTISGNKSNFEGAILNSNNSVPTFNNCIIWNNRTGSTTGSANSAMTNNSSSIPTITYSLIQTQNPSGTGNLNGIPNGAESNYPKFVTPLDPTSAPSTAGNFRLQNCSPVANVGDNSGLPSTDLDGNARIFGDVVDFGAFERQTAGTAPSTWYADADGDTFGNPSVSQLNCEQPTGFVSNNNDCNDTNPAQNPTTVWYLDADNDGYTTGAGVTQCATPGAGYRFSGILGGNDCNDGNANIHPGATEVCNNLDDDCDTEIDNGITFVTFYHDLDEDTYGNPNVNQSTCDGAPVGFVSNNNDCNDNDEDIYPGATEVCDGSIDHDCDGTVDNGCNNPISFTVFHPKCYGNSNGSIFSTVSGGTPPYSYLWSNGKTTKNINLLPAGTYTLTVSDVNGIVGLNSTTLIEPCKKTRLEKCNNY